MKKAKYIIIGEKPNLSFSLIAPNGEEIASSNTPYVTMEAALDGIESVRSVAVSAPIDDQTLPYSATMVGARYELYRRCQGKFYFDLRGADGRIVLISGAYVQKKSCLKGIASVRKNAAIAEIREG